MVRRKKRKGHDGCKHYQKIRKYEKEIPYYLAASLETVKK
jgi:hypothetical protein